MTRMQPYNDPRIALNRLLAFSGVSRIGRINAFDLLRVCRHRRFTRRKNMNLQRFCYSEAGTFGELTLPDGQIIYTVERPWLNNARGVSCIPIGKYQCKPRFYNRGGYEAVEVLDVPQRSHILFHVGNSAKDSKGCILPNNNLGCLKGDWAGLHSSAAFHEFMRQVNNKPFELTITNRIGGMNA